MPLKLVATLVVRDEADIVGAQIAYHLNAGVDYVIATDHESRDGTTEILEAYEREGFLCRISEVGPVREDVWRTRMARLAAAEYGADWVINMDADEFWWTRRATLKDLLASVPARFGVIGSMNRHFVPIRADDSPFFERMTVRVSPSVAFNDPTSPWRPGAKVAHRADPDVTVFHAGYAVVGRELVAVPDWVPLDMLHFPYRSIEQWVRKTTRRAYGDKSLGIYVKGHAAKAADRAEDVYSSIDVDDETVARGLATGVLVEDTRLRDALRKLVDTSSPVGFRLPDRPGDVAPACVVGDLHDGALIDVAALQDATLVRLQRRVDDVSRRSATLTTSSSGASLT